MRIIAIIIAALVIIVAIVASTATYTVDERQQALVLRFGTVTAVVNEVGDEDPGLHFKAPFIDDVIYFDKRNQEYDMRPAEILAADQERLVVDAFLRFRITNGLRVYQTVRDERGLRDRLRPIMDDTLRGVIASIPSNEVISGQRSSLMNRIEAAVAAQVENQDLGIEVIDVRILRADLPQQVAEQVFQRMASERQQEAQLIRSVGEERAREIRAGGQREATVIRADAQAEADRIRGEGDALRNRVYAEAYGQDAEFFDFYRSMIAYENAVRDGTPVIVPPDGEFFEYFGSRTGDRN